MTPLARAVALALVAHHAALAQEAPLAAMATVEIVATAPLDGLGIDRKLLPYALQSATSERIGAAHSDNLADFMARHLNGVNVNEISGSPFQNDISYRGFRASPVLGSSQGISVYLDGVRVNEPFGDVVNWDLLPEAAIATLLLVPGSNPVYGLNTLGGALALSSKSGASHPGMELDLSAGSGGRRRFDLARGSSDARGWHSFIGATLFDEDGWRQHSQGRLANVFVKLGRDEGGSAWSLSLLGGRSRLHGNGLLPDAMYREDGRAAYTFPDETRNRLLQLALKGSLHLDAGTEMGAIAYARYSRRDTVNGDVEDDGGGPQGVLNTTSTRQDSQGASALLSMRRGAHHIDIGAAFDRSAVDYAQFSQDGEVTAQREIVADPSSARLPSSSVTGSARALGVYAADTWTLARNLHLTSSARFNHAKVNNTLTSVRGLQPAESFSYSSLNPSLGLAGETLFANIAQGNRVPTVIELGCADPAQPCQLPVGLQSDPYLKQVIARTVEAGARFRHGAVSVYRTVNRNDILFLSSGLSRLGYFSNFERTRHQGLDASANLAMGALSLRVSYSYLNAVYDASGVLFTGVRTVPVARGTRIAGLPAHTLKLGADWLVGDGLTLGADMQAVSSIPTQGNEDGFLSDTQRADVRVHGGALLNLRASWEPAAHWEFYAHINNVFDRRHETFGALARNLFSGESNARFVAPGAPRMAAAGIRYRY